MNKDIGDKTSDCPKFCVTGESVAVPTQIHTVLREEMDEQKKKKRIKLLNPPSST